MAESRVKKENFILIQGWMISELKLKGNELIIYACIYGFSQAENQTFSGSLQYLADWTNSTKQGVIKCLKSLVEKGLLVKKENTINGVKFCEYYATEFNTLLNKVEYPIKQSLTGGMQQSLTNNIAIHNTGDKTEEKKEKSPFDAIITSYTARYEIPVCNEVAALLKEWVKVRKAKRAAMTESAVQMNLDKLDKLAAESNMSVPEYLKEVICRGWAAFYKIVDYSKQTNPPKRNQFNSYPQRQYDVEAIENMLLKQQNPPKTAGEDESIRERAEALKAQLGGK